VTEETAWGCLSWRSAPCARTTGYSPTPMRDRAAELSAMERYSSTLVVRPQVSRALCGDRDRGFLAEGGNRAHRRNHGQGDADFAESIE